MGDSGVFDTLVNLIKIGLGTGVLALPYAASVAGVVGAVCTPCICTENSCYILFHISISITLFPFSLFPHPYNRVIYRPSV